MFQVFVVSDFHICWCYCTRPQHIQKWRKSNRSHVPSHAKVCRQFWPHGWQTFAFQGLATYVVRVCRFWFSHMSMLLYHTSTYQKIRKIEQVAVNQTCESLPPVDHCVGIFFAFQGLATYVPSVCRFWFSHMLMLLYQASIYQKMKKIEQVAVNQTCESLPSILATLLLYWQTFALQGLATYIPSVCPFWCSHMLMLMYQTSTYPKIKKIKQIAVNQTCESLPSIVHSVGKLLHSKAWLPMFQVFVVSDFHICWC